MADSAAEIARNLDLSGHKLISQTPFGTFNEIHQSLTFFSKTHYHQYVPTKGAEHPDFETRLLKWLSNVATDDQRAILFELSPRVTFLTSEDVTKLHQSAIAGPICQWVVDGLGLSFDDPMFRSQLFDEIEHHTWFTSITDSMQISEFHHANNLGGTDFRPDWKSLAQFGDPKKIRLYMQKNTNAKGDASPLKRIVILEDFVGSGTQMAMGSGSVAFAASHFSDVPILLCPLIVCPEGASLARKLVAAHPNVTFSPVLQVTQDQLISPKTRSPNGSFEKAARDFCGDVHPLVEGDGKEKPRPYSAWGFRETGSLVVLYTNTPANSLPVIHHRSTTWNALFPRSARIR